MMVPGVRHQFLAAGLQDMVITVSVFVRVCRSKQTGVAIMGSPRKNGNKAEILNCLQVSVQENDRVEIIALCDYKIHGYTGCSSCQKDTGNFICVQKDDGNLLLGKIRKVVDEMKA